MYYLIGADIGTSGTKTALYNADGKLISSATFSYPLISLNPSGKASVGCIPGGALLCILSFGSVVIRIVLFP